MFQVAEKFVYNLCRRVEAGRKFRYDLCSHVEADRKFLSWNRHRTGLWGRKGSGADSWVEAGSWAEEKCAAQTHKMAIAKLWDGQRMHRQA